MNKLIKKFSIFAILFVVVFLLIGCKTNSNLNVKASLLVENANSKDSQQKTTIVEKNISFTSEELKEKEIDFSKKGKVYKEVIKRLENKNKK